MGHRRNVPGHKQLTVRSNRPVSSPFPCKKLTMSSTPYAHWHSPALRRSLTMARLFFYRQDDRHFLKQAVYNSALSLSGSLVLVTTAYIAARSLGADWVTTGVSSLQQINFGTVLGVVVVAPLIETFLVIAGLGILRSTGIGFFASAAVSGVAWGMLHGLLMPIRFLGTCFSFFVFSCAYLAWHRQSFRKAYWAATIPHMLINSCGVLAVLVITDV